MSRTVRAYVSAVTLPFVMGCYGVLLQPLPEPGDDPPAGVRGVVVEDGGDGERVEFARTDHVEWGAESIVITGVMQGDNGATGTVVTRTFPVTSVRGVLVRQLDGNKTSILVSVGLVGVIAGVALAISGQTTDSTVVEAPPIIR